MEFSIEYFESLPPKKKLEFIKSDEFEALKEKEPFILISLKEQFPPLKAYALKLAREIGISNIEIINQFLSDSNPVVRDSANKVISLLKKDMAEEEELKQEVEKIIQKGDKLEKINLIEKIKNREGSWVVDALFKFLEDVNWDVRNNTLKALSQRNDINIPYLLSLLKNPNWFVKSSVLELMTNKKIAIISSEVTELKKDPNLEVKFKLIEFFTKIGGQEVIPHLNELTNDSHSWVRKAALRALNELKKAAISSMFIKK